MTSASPTPHVNYHQTRVSFSSLPTLGTIKDTQASRSTGDIPLDADNLKVLIIQNDLLCNPCTAIQSLIEFDITYHVVYAFHDNAFKLLHPLLYEAIIILGGRHGAYEETKWLIKEKEFLRKSLALDIPILGICLGCQLLAEAIGGKVYAGTKGIEIGYKYWTYPNEQQFDDDDEKVQTEIHSPIQKKIAIHDRAKSNSFFEDKSMKQTIVKQIIANDIQEVTNLLDYYHKTDDDDEKDEEVVDFVEEIEEDDDAKFEREMSRPNFDKVIDSDSESESDSPSISPIDYMVKYKLDPFVRSLACDDRDQFIILFHGDTFDLPERCAITKQRVQILAKTDKYTSLFRVGQYSYGFQGHPELSYEMLSVWCKCWGDEWLAQWDGDLQNDVIEYARKSKHKIKETGRAIFDSWCKEVVLVKRKQKFLKTFSFEERCLPLVDEGVDSPECNSGSQ